MIHHKEIANTLFDIIHFADDEDIQVLLENCSIKCESGVSDKITLLNNIFNDVYYSIGTKLNTTLSFESNYNELKRTFRPVDPALYKENKPNNTLLYLHLYALSECYLSYQQIPSTEKSWIEQIAKEYKKEFNEYLGCSCLTNKNKTNFLKMIIQCYKEHGFYYYFYNDILVKTEIVEEKDLSEDDKINASYKHTYFKLVDTDKTTFIVNTDLNINYDIGTKLLRNSKEFKQNIYNMIRNANDSNIMVFFETVLTTTDFQTLKKFHSKIVEAIHTNKPVFCKCCNPDVNNPKRTKICDNCKNMFDEFEELKDIILNKTFDGYDSVIAKVNLKENFYKIPTSDTTNKEIRKKRKRLVLRIITQLENEFKKFKEETYYTEYRDKVDYLKFLIKLCFDE